MKKIATLLDTHFFPLIVSYTIHRAHIVFLVILWLALICGGSFTAFELVGGNYTNGLSALVSCIVLLQTMKHQQQTKQLKEHVDALHEENKRLHANTHSYMETIATLTAHLAKTKKEKSE